MVYRGKPSPGCASCRARRIKCDQRRPSCSQCLRVGRQCTGYRDLNALRLHDQSDEVASKSIQRAPPSPTPASLTLIRMAVPATDRALAFMFRHYVGDAQADSTTRGQLRFLHALSMESAPALTASVHAVGLAALANIHRSPRLMLEARTEYGHALRATSAALRDACTADSTLAAVALLSMYEIVNCGDSSLIGKWSKHIQGAMKLVRLRGSKQLENPIGLEMFTVLRMQMALDSIYRKAYTPAWLLQLSQEALMHHAPAERALDIFFVYVARVGDFCASLHSTQPDQPHQVISEALDLDTALVNWAMTLGSRWTYTVVRTPPSSDMSSAHRPVYGATYHVYPDSVAALLWNFSRFVRLIIHAVIHGFSTKFAQAPAHAARRTEYATLARQSARIQTQLAEEVCASVPPHLGPEDGFSGTGALRLIWPLFLAGGADGVGAEMKAWIIGCLERIGGAVGIHQAVLMAGLLRRGGHLELWDD
ncbi:Zn(II)2Cys6 transcription factor [Aspergillus clavatus NRRL 1]|uniref:C6 zinc finger domain protein n=1 Tax=Aspergillus clavatus (strain ATCC 1007 / CBS 513.65 / DSM 816 / NCTC 3887 / NRRL 1 / QM 1276 / 107) TaxID=344612 RepID=A1CN96_ASPCL|nr:C6 zinc finger domain protein [Aspergillus clavatus NRRL 1]EAW07117.1 C6 zinc finger domain protein [Aspergillus clavatus NRRL 1]